MLFANIRCTYASYTLQELENFENELMFMIKNIQFRKINNSFQSQLSEDIKQINRDSQIFVPADKSHNISKIDRETYEKLLHETITKTYKNKVRAINVDPKKIAKDLELEQLMKLRRCMRVSVTLLLKIITDFPQKICQLINPSKSDIGNLSSS